MFNIVAGTCDKLSDGAWTTHKRVLMQTDTALSYYRDVPKDMSDIINGKFTKVKQSLPFAAITAVTRLDPMKDTVQIKKLDCELTFKVAFFKEALVPDKIASPLVIDPEKPLKKGTCWYFAVPKDPRFG